ncbi:hypothetical protein DFH94DRAFT_686598 [Russula ochroleuca]|uniref:Uncharacterized protein n=1 Tax=Russula ochroleuca TaxID=152965 RepID=A0A9P5MKI6_9AGAM|nr:hypothetical protein DFH94DRAFT_686598 [Russula ochroleuca]
MERDGGIGKAAWRGRGRGSTSNAAVDAAWRGRAMQQRGEGGGGQHRRCKMGREGWWSRGYGDDAGGEQVIRKNKIFSILLQTYCFYKSNTTYQGILSGLGHDDAKGDLEDEEKAH